MKQLLHLSSLLAIALGILFFVGGIWGIGFTYKTIARESIVTPADSAIPEKPVRGPFTLKAQADAIREHVLTSTEGKTYAEMPRQIPSVDQNGNPVLDEQGEAIMTENTDRNLWVTATTLTTALNLGILTYAFFSLVVAFGIFSVWIGMIFRALGRSINFA